LGAAVRERRKAQGWTQERLAEEAGVSALQVGSSSAGDSVPKLTHILRVAQALRVRPGELLGSHQGAAMTTKKKPAKCTARRERERPSDL
jgi:transcriptional regulator with XRE-family HTH domain